ncbi:uncharacterized protein DC041_0000935 [Schistosoma bovis]|uniref:Protein kinase domain-containing protein n=1 Tax=Schistosoma bovis TaxID=6184 RepID=A0A430PX72_SCHBO|nr:uncharacterized protein DC041_0000935 [Schistosoma bovis]
MNVVVTPFYLALIILFTNYLLHLHFFSCTPKDNQSMFNDSDNFYRIIQHDHIAYRYEILSLLGKGSFGQVVSAYDHMKGCKVALKIIRTEPRFTRQVSFVFLLLNYRNK